MVAEAKVRTPAVLIGAQSGHTALIWLQWRNQSGGLGNLACCQINLVSRPVSSHLDLFVRQSRLFSLVSPQAKWHPLLYIHAQ